MEPVGTYVNPGDTIQLNIEVAASNKDNLVYSWTSYCDKELEEEPLFSDPTIPNPTYTFRSAEDYCSLRVNVEDDEELTDYGHLVIYPKAEEPESPTKPDITPFDFIVEKSKMRSHEETRLWGLNYRIRFSDYETLFDMDWSSTCTGGLEDGSFDNPKSQFPDWKAPPNPTGQEQECTITFQMKDVDDLYSWSHSEEIKVEQDNHPFEIVEISGLTILESQGTTLLKATVDNFKLYEDVEFQWEVHCDWSEEDGIFNEDSQSSYYWTAPENTTEEDQNCKVSLRVIDNTHDLRDESSIDITVQGGSEPLWTRRSLDIELDADKIFFENNSNFGKYLSSAGDFNGDGIDDLILGTSYIAPYNPEKPGGLYIFFGKPDDGETFLPAFENADVLITAGEAYYDFYRANGTSIGDFNGDGFDDIAVGASYADLNGENSVGKVYVFFGKEIQNPIELNAEKDANLIINGSASEGFFGRKVSGAGDFNGDGLADLMVGPLNNLEANEYIEDRDYKVTIYYGRQIDSQLILNSESDFDVSLENSELVPSFGQLMAPIGDFNGDGFDDVIFNRFDRENYKNEEVWAYIFYGRDDSGPLNLIAEADANVKISGDAIYRFSSMWLSSAGDFNGDGLGDVLISFSTRGGSRSTKRAHYILPGIETESFLDLRVEADSKIILEKVGRGKPKLEIGSYGKSLGDFNGDGFDDIAISGYYNIGEARYGGMFGIFGRKTEKQTKILTENFFPDLEIKTENSSSLSFFDVTGDFNGDDLDDILVGEEITKSFLSFLGQPSDDVRYPKAVFLYYGQSHSRHTFEVEGINSEPAILDSQEKANLTVLAEDSYSHELTYNWWSYCNWTSGNGSFDDRYIEQPVWTAPINKTGDDQTCNVSLKVNHGPSLSFSRDLDITVQSEPHLITLSDIALEKDKLASGVAIEISSAGTDSLDHDLFFSWSSECQGGLEIGSFGEITLANTDWTAPENLSDSDQICTLTLKADDGLHGLSQSISWDVTVEPAPHTLSISSIAPEGGTYSSLEPVSASVSAEDSHSHTLNYLWTSNCEGGLDSGVFTDKDVYNTTWMAPENLSGSTETCTLSATVEDGEGLSQTKSVSLQIEPLPPHTLTISFVTASPNEVEPLGTVSLSASAHDTYFHDSNYHWSSECTGGLLKGSFNDSSFPNPVWTASENQNEETHLCTLTVEVDDGAEGESDSATIEVSVHPAPKPEPLVVGPSVPRVISPYWQMDRGFYTFISVSHPALSTMSSQIGVVVEAYKYNGDLFRSTEFTISQNQTQRIFIVETNHPMLNFDALPAAKFMESADSYHGNLVIKPKASHPEQFVGDSNAEGRGYPDISQLHFWGVLVSEESTTGFPLEFIGDGNDSRAFITPNFSGIN